MGPGSLALVLFALVPFPSATYFSSDTGSVQIGWHSCTSLHNQIFRGHTEERAETKKKKKQLLSSANLHFLKTYVQEG